MDPFRNCKMLASSLVAFAVWIILSRHLSELYSKSFGNDFWVSDVTWALFALRLAVAGCLALVVFSTRRALRLIGILIILMILYGYAYVIDEDYNNWTVLETKTAFESAVSTFTFTLRSQDRRRATLEREFLKAEITGNTYLYGVDDLPAEEREGAYLRAATLGYNETFHRCGTPWCLVLEDDATFLPHFKNRIERLIDIVPPRVNLVWLDVRSRVSTFTRGNPACCTAGMLFRKDVLLLVNRRLARDYAPAKALDLLLGGYCNDDGGVVCLQFSAVRESGAETTIRIYSPESGRDGK